MVDDLKEVAPEVQEEAEVNGADALSLFLGEEESQEVAQGETEEVAEESSEEASDEVKEEVAHDEEALIARINEGENISDEEIEFLKSKGHEINVEGEDLEEGKEEDKPEGVLPEFVDELKGLKYFEGHELDSPEKIQESLMGYVRTAEKTNEKLVGILNDNPELAKVMVDLSKGIDPAEAIKDHFSELFNDEDAPDPSDPEYRSYLEKQIKAKDAKKAAIKAEQERQTELVKNSEESKRKAQEFVKSKGWDDKQADRFFGDLNKIFVEATNLKVSDTLMELITKGYTRDEDVSSAERLGETKALNRKITLVKSKPVGDGLKRVKRHESNQIKSDVTYKTKEAKELEEFLH